MSTDDSKFDDADHVRRALRGDQDALDSLVREHYAMVHAIAAARLHPDSERAEELSQEVFLRAYLHLERLDNPDRFPAWLAQITRNLASDWQRRERARSALVQMISSDHSDVPELPSQARHPRETAAQNEQARQLSESLAKLPPEQRELLLMHFAEDMTQSQIARRLQVHPSTIMRKLDQALARLRTIYSRDAAGGLRSMRRDDRALRRTLAVIAAASALSVSQRASLAAAADKLLPGAISTSAIRAPIFRTSAGQIGVAFGVIAALALAGIVGSSFISGENGRFYFADKFKDASVTGGSTLIQAIDEDNHSAPASKGLPARRLSRSTTTTTGQPVKRTRASINATTHSQQSKTETGQEDALLKYQREGGSLGSVLDDSGNPLANLRISFRIMTPAAPLKLPSIPANKQVLTAFQPMQQLLHAHTDSNGRFHISPLATGSAVMIIDHPPYAQLLQKTQLPAENIQVRLSMIAANINGSALLLSTGEPVSGATVAAIPSESIELQGYGAGSTHTYTMPGEPLRTTTDASGHFSIGRLPAGKITLEATADDLIMVPVKFLGPEEIVLDKGKAVQLPDIYMYSGHIVTGRVTDTDTKEPISGATIGYPLAGGQMYSFTGKSFPPAISDADGYYKLTHLKPLDFHLRQNEVGSLSFVHLTATKEGYRPSSYRPVQPGGFDPNNLEMHHDFTLRREQPD